MVKYSAAKAAAKGRIVRRVIAKTREVDIARQAREDGTGHAATLFQAALRQGRLRVVRPLDVTAIRAKTGLSQDGFARAFQISPHTLRNWEQGRRAPEGPARALLLAIDREPEALMRALQV